MKKLKIVGGQVIDPYAGTSETRSIYIEDGAIVAEFSGDGSDAFEVVDATGCYVTPGLVDSHVHVFERHAKLSVNADVIGIQQAVCTVVDAGSTGIRDFEFFEKEIIANAKTDVRFFLNISRTGLCDNLFELADPKDWMTPEELANFQSEHKDRLVGLKVRMSSSVVKDQGIAPLQHARMLSDQSGLPLMIHIGNAPPELGDVLDLLQKGDIVTHCFNGKVGGIPYYGPAFVRAVERGVHFDVGHGTASFSYETLPQVMAIQPIDFTISTDLYSKNLESPVGSLLDTMAKIVASGESIEDVVRRTTSLPRSFLGMPPSGVSVGDTAHISIFRKDEGARILVDSEGYHITPKYTFHPVATILGGVKLYHETV